MIAWYSGVDLIGGGLDSRGSYVSKILYVEMKESGPSGGARARHAPQICQCSDNVQLGLVVGGMHFRSPTTICKLNLTL